MRKLYINVTFTNKLFEKNSSQHLTLCIFQRPFKLIRYLQKMMCDLVARTNWSNIKSNYFVSIIIIFNLSYYRNITITVTFVNQPMLCRAFFSFLQRITCTSPMPSSTLIFTYLVFTLKFLTAPTNLTI
jgi:hypothetical protein